MKYYKVSEELLEALLMTSVCLDKLDSNMQDWLRETAEEEDHKEVFSQLKKFQELKGNDV